MISIPVTGRSPVWRAAAVLMMGAALAACGGTDSQTAGTAADSGMDATAGHDVAGHDMAGHDTAAMPMDAGMMHRHAAEMDSMVAELRAHLGRMRQLPPADWHARMDQHAPRVARMLGMMDRQMSEMDMGMNMDAASMGAMMGRSAAQHEAMLRDMDALRGEAEQLQTASPDQVRALMPAHLDRLERMVEDMQGIAGHMRRADAEPILQNGWSSHESAPDAHVSRTRRRRSAVQISHSAEWVPRPPANHSTGETT